jgi:hypothetical protein
MHSSAGTRPAVFCISIINPQYIINFPTKDHWKNPSSYEYINLLSALLSNYLNLKQSVKNKTEKFRLKRPTRGK